MAFSTHDIVSDSPTNNFATWNGLVPISTPLYDGALQSYGSSSGNTSAFSTIQIPTTGKWYIEILLTNAQAPQCGIAKITCTGSGTNSDIYGYYDNATTNAPYALYDGSSQSAASSPGSATISSGFNATTGNITRIYINADNNQIWFGNNTNWATSDNSLGSTPTFGTSGVFNNSLDLSDGYFVFVSNGNTTDRWFLNAGQDPTFGGNKSPTTTYTDANGIGAFYYQPPTDAKALCTANLSDFTPDVAGDVPQDYFKTVKYTGKTNSSTYNNGVVTVGFPPDLIWIKARNQSYNHTLFDSVRGFGKKHLFSDLTSQELANEYGHVSGTNAYSFSVADGASGDTYTNNSSTNYVAWCFRAGGAPTADNSNTSGAMTANSVSLNGTLQSNYTPAGSPTIYPKRMSINTDAGFSIVKYQGVGTSTPSTIPHGLNHSLDFYIVKSLDSNGSWELWFNGFTASEYMQLNSTTQKLNYSNAWGSVPTDSTFGINNSNNANYLNENYIAYCWHSVEGYSKFGSYVGNNTDNDGVFVFTGFKPAVLILRSTSNSRDWIIVDNARSTYNPIDHVLVPNTSGSETTLYDNPVDFLSNGFKLKTNEPNFNAAETHIYACFAEQPFKFSNAR
jgi:hypothetical protein